MKENEDITSNIFLSVITALKAAEEANKWIFWRDKFQTNHPDHNPEEIDNLEQWSLANYTAARHLYCAYKDKLDQFVDSCWDEPMLKEPSKDKCAMMMALRNVVELEMTQQIEEHLVSSEQEEPVGYWEGDEFLPLPKPDSELDSSSYY